jgi:hypothetical protein
MDHPLQAINWRIERADHHLAALDRERSAFLHQKDRRIIGHVDRETREYVFRFGGELPDPRIGLIVGEFGHHLRAALDNLVWQLVLLRGGSPTQDTQFPIYGSRERYDAPRGAPRMLRGVNAEDRAAIEAIQPFQYGEHAPQAFLTLLGWLNNVDKHRFLHIGCAMPIRTPIRVSYGTEGPDAGLFPWNPYPVRDVRKILGVDYLASIASDDRAELMRVRFEPSGPDPQMEVKGDPSVEIALSDPEQALIFTDLGSIRQHVVAIIDAFRPRFDI